MLFLISSSIASGSADQFIEKAHQLSRSGDIDSAIVVIQEAIKRYPNNAQAWASLGIFRGIKASKAADYTDAGQLIFEAFNYLDKGIEIDSTLARSRLWRVILGVKVPEFMGRLE